IAALFGWGYFVLRYAGFKTLIFDLFGNKADKEDVGVGMYVLLFPIFIGVGFIEVVSILFRPVSLSFRLYGNVFGGENLLANMTGLAPYVVPVPFYFLETLIGLVQALVFTLLTAVYIGLICNHGDEHEAVHH
ncbi:MAG: F0F1 ATP synthase subunit A, partial [Verrucomicrobiota bacterium]